MFSRTDERKQTGFLARSAEENHEI